MNGPCLILADIWGSIVVMICVTMTLVDVMGYMHFWGLTIDVVSSVIIIISIGLCVDYSAHIAHAFLSVQGATIYIRLKTRFSEPQFSEILNLMNKLQLPFLYFTLVHNNIIL